MNEIIKKGYKLIKVALAKMINKGKGNWVKNLPITLLANHYITKATTGLSLFYIIYSKEAVLPIELFISTWRILK